MHLKIYFKAEKLLVLYEENIQIRLIKFNIENNKFSFFFMYLKIIIISEFD